MDRKKIYSTKMLIKSIKEHSERREGKLQTVKWVKDHSELDLRSSKELVDEHFYYPKEEE